MIVSTHTARNWALGLLFGVAAATTASAQASVTSRGQLSGATTTDWNAVGAFSNPMTVGSFTVSTNGDAQHLVTGSNWAGGFNTGDGLYFAQGGDMISFSFAGLVTGVATQAWTNYPPGGTVTVTSWRGGLQTFQYSLLTGGGGASNDNQAAVLGIQDASGFDRLDIVMTGNSPNEFSINQFDVTAGAVTSTPEPATMALFATGLLGLGAVARRRRSAANG